MLQYGKPVPHKFILLSRTRIAQGLFLVEDEVEKPEDRLVTSGQP